MTKTGGMHKPPVFSCSTDAVFLFGKENLYLSAQLCCCPVFPDMRIKDKSFVHCCFSNLGKSIDAVRKDITDSQPE